MTLRFDKLTACSALMLTALAAPADGQPVTVQLPTFRQFSMGTTVVVPDRGSISLGGISGRRGRASSFGLPLLPGTQRGQSLTRTHSGVSVHAWIHDLEAMDREILARGLAGKNDPVGRSGKGEGLRSALPEPPDPPPRTIAQLRAARQAERLARKQQALTHFEAGTRAQEQGKSGVARIYYRMALRDASGEFRETVAHRLAALSAELSADIALGRR